MGTGLKGVPVSSYGYQITLKTSETTNSRSQITIMATKTMSDETPAFRKNYRFIGVSDGSLFLELVYRNQQLKLPREPEFG